MAHVPIRRSRINTASITSSFVKGVSEPLLQECRSSRKINRTEAAEGSPCTDKSVWIDKVFEDGELQGITGPEKKQYENAQCFQHLTIDGSSYKETGIRNSVAKLDIYDGNLVTDSIFRFQKCRKERNLELAKHVHARICRDGIETQMGNHIVPMFVECWSLSDAQQIFNTLLLHNEHSWTSLIFGYIESGQFCHALDIYKKMQEEKIDPSTYTLSAVLRACGKMKDVEKGREIHIDIRKSGLESNLFVGSTLINMYIKCGSLSEARKAFDNLPARNPVCWTTLIGGYTEHGYGNEALECFEKMRREGVSPDAVTFVCCLKACSSMRSIDRGINIHSEIMNKGLEMDVFIGNALVDMYSKCGLLVEARKVFEKLPVQDVITWTALLDGHVESGACQEALNCFVQMEIGGVHPDAMAYVSALKACISIASVHLGQKMHAHILQKGYATDCFVGSTLIDMYAKFGLVLEAEGVFGKLPNQDIIPWNVLIAGYVENGLGHTALKYFEQMQLEGVFPTAVTYLCCLKACGSLGALDRCRELHTEIAQKGLENDPRVCNVLVDVYAKGGSLVEAQEVFDKLPVRDVITWTSLISSYADNEFGQEAFNCLEQMQLDGIYPDALAFASTLKSCGSLGAIDRGREIHTEIAQKGFGTDVFVGNALIDMYAKCGFLPEAEQVFDQLPAHDVVSWTSLIAGYAENGLCEKAMKCFEQMQLQGVAPNATTFVCVLKACGSMRDIKRGRKMHIEAVEKGFTGDVFVGNSLLDMYIKCGELVEAREAFDKLPVQSIMSWNALITGYAEKGPASEVLKCFDKMKLKGASPDALTFGSIIKACGSLGAMGKGHEIHFEIAQKGLDKDVFVCTSLIDMYAKGGLLSEAREVFDRLPIRDVISWNAIIRGYGMNYEGVMAIKCFENMQEQGIKPDSTTFICLLAACSRASLFVQGQCYFECMEADYGIVPTIDHFACMIDLVARCGRLCDAEKMLKTAPQLLSEESLTAMLSACKIYGEIDIGLRCFQQLAQMYPEKSAPYVLMANIYAGAGRWNEASRIEEQRKRMGAKKKPAMAVIEVNKTVHEFVVGNTQSKDLSAMLEMLKSRMKEDGYVPHLDLVLKPVSQEAKEAAICGHAEKVAIAFGLLHTSQGQTLHVNKNLRMCNDCHNASKIISKIEKREIILRESNWIHHFKDGLCSCGDMW